MELVTPGANGHPPSPVAPTTISPDSVVHHLTELLEITLGASPEDLESRDSLFSPSRKQDTLQRCARFASESQVALYVQKDVVDLERKAVDDSDAEAALSSGDYKNVRTFE